MKRAKMLKVFSAVIIIIALFGFLVSANAVTREEKQLSRKNMVTPVQQPTQPPTLFRHGGPDGGGYYYIDSDDDASNKPVFNWIDITGFGTNLGFNGDDQLVTGIQIGFSFTFYGSSFTSLTASTNGWAGFGSYTNAAFLNATIPTSATPNDFLPVFWDDMDCSVSGSGYSYTNNVDTCIVSWVDVPHYSFSGTGVYTFQIILTGDGKIVYQYLSTTGTLNSYTTGIENGTGAIGTLYTFNTEGDLTGKAIYFGLTPPIFSAHDVSPSAFVSPGTFGNVGSPIIPVVTFLNIGQNTETFTGRLLINHNGQVYNQTQQITGLAPAASANATFPSFTPSEAGVFELVAVSELVGDGNNANDTLRFNYTVYAAVYFQDFEASDGFFVGDNDWQWGAPTNPGGPGSAHSGVNVWAAGLAAPYTVGPLLSTLTTPAITLGTGASLSFWHWYILEDGFDGGNVKISTDAGATWTLLTPATGYDGALSTAYANPIGGEEAFTGDSNGWKNPTFDLSTYTGTSAIFKFDFGSDNSFAEIGWFIDDFTVLGGGSVAPGWIAGTVRDLATNNPINGAFVNVASRRDTTDVSGHYIFELIPGSYNLTASALNHNNLTASNVSVTQGDTTTQNFLLTAPVMQVNTAAIDTTISMGGVATFTRTISNTGNGPLDYQVAINSTGLLRNPRVRVETATPQGERILNQINTPAFADVAPNRLVSDPPTICDFGDEVFTFDPQTPTTDNICLGVEFDGNNFWVTGSVSNTAGAHMLHKFDRNGIFITSYSQGAGGGSFGWRDMAWDGTYLYAAHETEFAKIDPATGLKVATLPIPTGVTLLRGLAYDPATDHFWTANYTSNIIEFTRTGQVIHSYPNTLSAYGLAWDDVSEGGPWLWVFSQDGVPPMLVSQFDPRTGQYTGVSFAPVDHGGQGIDVAGGACFTTAWDPAFGILFVLDQGATTDLVLGYEITPNVTWLNAAPTSGTINAGQSVNLIITVDFSGTGIVPDSTYHGSIVVTSNAPGTATIPVTAHVGAQGVDEQSSGLPREFSLAQNYPNPFNPTTTISFNVPYRSHVDLAVFDITGARVASLMNSDLEPGSYRVNFNGMDEAGRSLSSGVYFYRLSTDSRTFTKKMVLMK